MTDITMRQLLKAGAHFGHQTRYWSPDMAPYLFGERKKIHIINLEKTLPMLKEALNYLGAMTTRKNRILFVGTKPQASKWVREQAIRCGSPWVDHRWLGGMLTNYKTVRNSIARLKELEERIRSGEAARLSKKEALSLTRECAKLDKTLSGIKDMDGLPDVLFVIDVEHEYIAVSEANKLGIPVVAVVDSNCSPAGVDYIIPSNDDSSRVIQLYLTAAADAIEEARMSQTVVVPGDDEYVEVDDKGEIIYPAGDSMRNSSVVAERLASEAPATEKQAQKAPQEEDKKVAQKKVFRKKAPVSQEVGDKKVCPECPHVFSGNGWDGIDAHWRSKHEHIMPYEEAWPLIRDDKYIRSSLSEEK